MERFKRFLEMVRGELFGSSSSNESVMEVMAGVRALLLVAAGMVMSGKGYKSFVREGFR
jgi:hypothetical protein